MSCPKAEVLCNNDLRSLIVSFANTTCGKCKNCRIRIQAVKTNWKRVNRWKRRGWAGSKDDDYEQDYGCDKEKKRPYSPICPITRTGTGIVINGHRTEVFPPSPPRAPRRYDSDDERIYVPDCTVQ